MIIVNEKKIITFQMSFFKKIFYSEASELN